MENDQPSLTGMKEEDKATSTIVKSPSQELIKKVDDRDKLVRAIEVVILLVVVAFNIFLGLRLQSVVDTNRLEAEQRAMTAGGDSNENKRYLKCLALIRFDAPPEDLTTREGMSKALDNCAKH